MQQIKAHQSTQISQLKHTLKNILILATFLKNGSSRKVMTCLREHGWLVEERGPERTNILGLSTS